MLKRVHLKNFCAFSEADFQFSKNINVFIGDNGTCKSSLLKLCHAAESASFSADKFVMSKSTAHEYFSSKFKSNLTWAFRAKEISHLANFNAEDYALANVIIEFEDENQTIEASFNNISASSFSLKRMPSKLVENKPIWIDFATSVLSMPDPTCVEIHPTIKDKVNEICEDIACDLRKIVGKTVSIDHFGRCCLIETAEPLNPNCFSESIAIMLVLLRLIKTGAVFGSGQLFLDSPDANFGPKLTKTLSKTICALSESGVQVFLATQKNSMLEEIQSASTEKEMNCKFFLHQISENGMVRVAEYLSEGKD
jgi:predicted ATPase